ncbi:MAG: YwaF family protein [Candidatus Izemoplasmatales bacterium]|nr:YwaF family protein [Candidatus Izemoplasmatales bacterium]
MNLLALIAVIALSLILFFTKKTEYKNYKIAKIMSTLLFLVFLFRLFTTEDALNNVFNVLLYDIDTPRNAAETWLFSPGMTVIIIFLRWLTMASLLWLVLAPYIKVPAFNILGQVVGTIVGVLNLVFFEQHLIAMTNNPDMLTFKAIQYLIETALLLFIAFSSFLNSLRNKEHRYSGKEVLWFFLVFAGSLFAVMPQTMMYNLFGYYGEVPDEFTMSHIFVIVFPFALIFLVNILMKNRSRISKEALIAYIVFAAFTQYFYMRRETLEALPLHLCNTAVVLLLLAYVFKIKGFFYFSYFANVLGALAAILLPNYSSDLFSYSVIHYGYNHLYAFITPLLCVSLGVFPRPTLSHMYRAILVFSGYFVAVVFLNAWFNNYANVDYFFTYSDFLTDMFNIKEIQFNHIIEFTYKNLTFRFYWLFQTLYFLVFIVLMFASWYVYDAFFQMSDQRQRLKAKQRLIKIDKLKLLELLDGRKPSEPMNPGGKDMIKINHFSKKYGQSERYAVKDFSLEIHGGEIYGFLGHNGAGKSTTIKSIVGIQSITEGEIEVCGYSIKSQPLEAKLRIGYVSDNHAVYEKLTGREYINYVADLYLVPKKIRDERLNALAIKLSLIDVIDQMIKSYSHGMKQKLVVIASLIHEPPVWILDEPLTGLDPISAFQIKETMRDHASKGNIVFFSSHVIEVVEKICTKIAVITQGQLTGVYDINVLKDKNISLEELYMRGINQGNLAVDYV